MKLNTGIIAYSLPVSPKHICGNPDHNLIFSDVRFFRDEKGFYDEDILYFTEWGRLKESNRTVPTFMFCVGGDTEAVDFLRERFNEEDGGSVATYGRHKPACTLLINNMNAKGVF